ncbi:CoA transferase [Rhodococcus sp. NPDC057529]|uniref:CoA transferase n=1 Tax=Rhodococcus sp. NPDC057529 TaxID=3346158 RepID=UPI0036702DB3
MSTPDTTPTTGTARVKRGMAEMLKGGVIAPHGAFNTSDGMVSVVADDDRQWRRLCAALSLPGMRDDPRFVDNRSRLENQQELDSVLQAVLSSETTASVLAAAGRAGAAISRVQTRAPQEVADSALHPAGGSESETQRRGAPSSPDAAESATGDPLGTRAHHPSIDEEIALTSLELASSAQTEVQK